jgi:SAM-dependent methyltransferase
MDALRGHWDKVYETKAESAVSWYQPHPALSLKLIQLASPDGGASVIDVGGGASTLVDDLVAKAFADVTVLDISGSALDRSKARLGGKAASVGWIVADITRWTPLRTWDIWHDRAAFHFLTDPAAQTAYIAALTAATRPGATVIISTFGPDGPERCSGLAVERYGAEALARRLGPAFALIADETDIHTTPWGTEQRFSYVVLKRTAAPAE